MFLFCQIGLVEVIHKVRTTKLMHSTPVSHDYQTMLVKVLPALTDNYMYLLIDKESRQAAIVDPVDPKVVLRAAEAANVTITMVLTTHHHSDHAGGNAELVKKLKNPTLKVIGGDDRIPAMTNKVQHNDELSLGSLMIKCLHTPCHTIGHFCYYVTSPNAKHPVVFTGDTLFVAGCGNFFEGTAEQMDEALNKRLANLPDETRIYCGHEYTRRNLEFAEEVEPRNENSKMKLHSVLHSRSAKIPTVPSTIAEEKDTNPFMRVHTEEVKRFAQKTDRIEVMQIVRNSKDNF